MAKDKSTRGVIALIRPGESPGRTLGKATNRIVPLTLRYCNARLLSEGYFTVEFDGLVSPFTPLEIFNWAKLVRPRLAVFSIDKFQQADLDSIFALTSALKKGCDAKTIAYGPYPTFFPQRFFGKDRFDAVLLGEPEATVIQAASALLAGNSPDISGVATIDKKGGSPAYVKNVDTLPLPVRYEKDLRQYYSNYPLPISKKAVWGSLLAGRGCGRGCSFCSPFDRATFSKKVRPRSIESVKEEALMLTRAGANILSFEDDNPTFARERTFALADALAQVPASFICHARVDELDGDQLRALASAGCVMIKLGIESGSPGIINRLCKGDGQTFREKAVYITKMARRLGMATCGLFIIGSPGETEADLSMTHEMMLEADLDIVQFHFFTPYPGSAAFDLAGGKLTPESAASLYHYDSSTLNQASFSTLPPSAVIRWQKRLFRSFVLRPEFMISHLRRFGRFYLHNPMTPLRLLGGLEVARPH